MITKQELDDMYREAEELEVVWNSERKKNHTTTTRYAISHKLLGLFLTGFNSDARTDIQNKLL